MRSALSLLAALALGACATLPDAVRSDGHARLGEATRVGALIVTPRSIVEDSRCPVNARCVWAGRVIVRTDVTGAGWRETRDLTLGERTVTHGVTLGLVSVEPGKMAGAEAQPRASVFGFVAGD